MEEKLYSINDIVKWYSKNVDTEISDDFLIHIINKGIIKPKEMSLYSLNELNDKGLLGELLMTVKAVTERLGIKSYRTVINTGKEAGQEVFHLHIHILAGRIH